MKRKLVFGAAALLASGASAPERGARGWDGGQSMWERKPRSGPTAAKARIMKLAASHGVCVGTVQRIKAGLAGQS
jgi:hypothetical protein